VKGRVEKLVLDGQTVVGLVVQRPVEHYADGDHTPVKLTVWLNDVDPSRAKVTVRGESGAAGQGDAVQAGAITEPDSTFPIMFPIGWFKGRRPLAPLAVGDDMSFEFKEKNGSTILVGSRDHKVEAIVRDERGDPVGIKFRYRYGEIGDKIYPYDPGRIDAGGLVTVYFSEILRGSELIRLETSAPGYLDFAFPRARMRGVWETSYAWLPGLGAETAFVEDSGEFTLRVGLSGLSGKQDAAEGPVQCPVAVGDEILASVKDLRPDTVLGFAYERFTVLAILKGADGKTWGFRTERFGSGDPTTVLRLEDINRDDSYIKTKKPYTTPGAWAKRAPYVPEVEEGHREGFDSGRVADFIEGLFRQAAENSRRIREELGLSPAADEPKPGQEAAPWTSAPAELAEWLSVHGLADNEAGREGWARWVLQVPETASVRMIREQVRAMYKMFHPDLSPDNEEAERVSKIIGQAKDILLGRRKG
jgi:hypothetical protein